VNLTITNPPLVEDRPWCIRRITGPGDHYDSENFRFDGPLARVSPTTAEDVALIRLMRHGIDYFAPVTGNGILVKPELLIR